MASRKTLTHLGRHGEAHMVDVSKKRITARLAVAEGRIVMQPATLDLVLRGNVPFGADRHTLLPRLTPESFGSTGGKQLTDAAQGLSL